MATLDNNTIFIEILPKLPTKSLIRFKCVSKLFNSAISSPELIDLHRRRHRISTSYHHFILPSNRSINCHDVHRSISLSTPTSTFTWSDSSDISVVGSSNGLLCVFVRNAYVRSSDCHACILNPTTRMNRNVSIPFPKLLGFRIGFVFDPQTLDHKIVFISHHTDKTLITRVFSLNNNSWNIIQTPQLAGDLLSKNYNVINGVLINHNLLHWIIWNQSTRLSRIVCFNVSENNWTNDVLLPEIYYHDPTRQSHFLYEIGVLDGCLFTFIDNNYEGLYEVWVMQEYGIQDSWFRLLAVPKLTEWMMGRVSQWERLSKMLLWYENVVTPYNRLVSGELLIHPFDAWDTPCWLDFDTTVGGMINALYHSPVNFREAYLCGFNVAPLLGGKLFEES